MKFQQLAPRLNYSIVATASATATIAALAAATVLRIQPGSLYLAIAAIASLIGVCAGIMFCLGKQFVQENGIRAWAIDSVRTWASLSLLGLVYPLVVSPGAWTNYLNWVASGILFAPLVAIVNRVPRGNAPPQRAI